MENNNNIENKNLETTVSKKKKLPIWAILTVSVIVITIIFGSITVARSNSTTKRFTEQLELARIYVAELNYEQAIIAYMAAIEISPKNVDAYIELADVYIEINDAERAHKILQQAESAVSQKDKEKIEKKINEIEQMQIISADQNTTPTQNDTTEIKDDQTNNVPSDILSDNNDSVNDEPLTADNSSQNSPMETYDETEDVWNPEKLAVLGGSVGYIDNVLNSINDLDSAYGIKNIDLDKYDNWTIVEYEEGTGSSSFGKGTEFTRISDENGEHIEQQINNTVYENVYDSLHRQIEHHETCDTDDYYQVDETIWEWKNGSKQTISNTYSSINKTEIPGSFYRHQEFFNGHLISSYHENKNGDSISTMLSEEYQYDQSDNVISSLSREIQNDSLIYSDSYTYEYSFDIFGRKTKSVCKDETGNEINHTEYYYNDSGKIIKEIQNSPDGTELSIYEWTWSDSGKCLRILQSRPQSNFFSETKYEYDDDNKVKYYRHTNRHDRSMYYDEIIYANGREIARYNYQISSFSNERYLNDAGEYIEAGRIIGHPLSTYELIEYYNNGNIKKTTKYEYHDSIIME